MNNLNISSDLFVKHFRLVSHTQIRQLPAAVNFEHVQSTHFNDTMLEV